jgi:hypothetical protein
MSSSRVGHGGAPHFWQTRTPASGFGGCGSGGFMGHAAARIFSNGWINSQ